MKMPRLTTATTVLAVVGVAGIAGYVSYEHAHEMALAGGTTGLTAWLLPGTVDGLVWASSMVLLDAGRRGNPAPQFAKWCLGSGLFASLCANAAQGWHHHILGLLVNSWPAWALFGSFHMLMHLIRSAETTVQPVAQAVAPVVEHVLESLPFDEPLEPEVGQDAPSTAPLGPELEQLEKTTPLSERQFIVHQHLGGMSARKIERVHGIDRRRAGRIINDYKNQKTELIDA